MKGKFTLLETGVRKDYMYLNVTALAFVPLNFHVSLSKVQNMLYAQIKWIFPLLPIKTNLFVLLILMSKWGCTKIKRMDDALDFFREVDIMIGGNSIDGALLMPIWLSALGQTDPEQFMIPRALYETLFIPLTLSGYYTYIPNIPQSAKDAVAFEYTNWTDPDDNVARNLQAVNMATDFAVFSPMIYTALSHAKNDTSSTYVYKFSTRPGTHLINTPSWLDGPTKANHADEIAFVFGFSERMNVQYQKFGVTFNVTAEDIRVSKLVMTLWTNFAKSG